MDNRRLVERYCKFKKGVLSTFFIANVLSRHPKAFIPGEKRIVFPQCLCYNKENFSTLLKKG